MLLLFYCFSHFVECFTFHFSRLVIAHCLACLSSSLLSSLSNLFSRCGCKSVESLRQSCLTDVSQRLFHCARDRDAADSTKYSQSSHRNSQRSRLTRYSASRWGGQTITFNDTHWYCANGCQSSPGYTSSSQFLYVHLHPRIVRSLNVLRFCLLYDALMLSASCMRQLSFLSIVAKSRGGSKGAMGAHAPSKAPSIFLHT